MPWCQRIHVFVTCLASFDIFSKASKLANQHDWKTIISHVDRKRLGKHVYVDIVVIAMLFEGYTKQNVDTNLSR